MQLSCRRQNTRSKCIEIYKRMLLSRDTDEQMKAVNSIHEILRLYEGDFETYVSLIDWLLMNDICVFLCEASATLQLHLLRLILKCFQKFSAVPSFYTRSHSPQVITSIIRTIQFLVKENGSEKVIHELLCFVSDVIKASKEYHSPPIISRESIYNVIQIFELLSIILDKISYETETKINIAFLLHNVIGKIQKKTGITLKALAFAKDVIEKCLHSLNQILVISRYKCSMESKLDGVFGLICNICIDSLHLCDNSVVIPTKTSKEIMKQDYKASIKEVICTTLVQVTSQMKEFELFVLKPNYDIFLELLNEFLNQQNITQDILLSFAQHLCSHGFLAFLGQLTPMSVRTKKLCLINLAEILSILSVEVFNINNARDDVETFKRYLFEGFMEIGFNYKLWPQKLNDMCASDSTIHALIIYIYFNCLYSLSPDTKIPHLLPYLVEFILQLPRRGNCPQPILKCLWLIFSIASVCNNNHSTIRGGILRLHRAISIMSNLLLLNVKNVYTHHPYIVRWTFSSHRISTVIQNQVLSLWLKKEAEIPDELTSIPTLWNSLLEIIIHGEGEVDINLVKSLLMKCIQEHSQDNDPIRHELWDTLPDVLRSLSIGKTTNVQMVLCLIELCNVCPPKLPNLSTIQITASLLSTLLVASKKYNVNVQNHFIREAYSILISSLLHEDKFVLSQYINTPIFLQCVYDATLSEDVTLSRIAYEILSIAMYYKAHFNIMSPNCVKMDPVILITSLRDERDSQKSISLLTLIHQALKLAKKDINAFVVLAPVYPKDQFLYTYRALFFRLQMTCCKDLKNESLISWYALNTMLEFAATRRDIPELIITLASQPWTHKLIHFYLYQNTPAKCRTKFLTFVFNWLTCQEAIWGKSKEFTIDTQEVFQPQAESSVMYRTLGRIIHAFSDDSLQTELSTQKKNIVNSILNLISETVLPKTC